MKGTNKGFTLLELLVVLVILGLLASLVGPQVIKQIGGSKTKTAALQIEEFSTALDLFHLEVGRYPTTGEGLDALVENPSGVRFWNGPYLKKKVIRQDPWGNDYVYRSPGDYGAYDYDDCPANPNQTHYLELWIGCEPPGEEDPPE